MIREQIRRNMGADIAGGASQKNSHVFWVSGRRCRRCARCSGGARFACARKRHVAPRAGFRRTPFDQRIAPLAQRRNVDIDPVVPPIERAGIVAEMARSSGGSAALSVPRWRPEYVVVVENERLKERDELDHFFQFALLPRQRRRTKGIGSTLRLIACTIIFCAGAESFS